MRINQYHSFLSQSLDQQYRDMSIQMRQTRDAFVESNTCAIIADKHRKKRQLRLLGDSPC
jgi:RecA/RadA recombinase